MNIELAAVNPKKLTSFIKVFFAAVATLATDSPSKALASNASGWIVDAKTVDKEIGTDVVSVLFDVIKNGPPEDEFELIAKAKAFRKALATQLRSTREVSHSQLDALKAASAYVVTRKETMLRQVQKAATLLGEPSLIDALAFEAGSQKDLVKPLEKIVYAATKRKNSTALTAEEQKKLKAKYPQLLKEYKELRTAYTNVWQDELRNFVVNSGKPTVEFDKVTKHLASLGIEHPLLRGFVGRIDSNGRLFTTAGKLIDGAAKPGSTVRMNPDYDPKEDNGWVFKVVGEEGQESGEKYTADYKAQANTKKFEKVRLLRKILPNVRQKWLRMLKMNDLSTKNNVAALVLECLWQFSARIGSPSNKTAGETTFGLSTVVSKQMRVDANQIRISYPGKKGVTNVHVLVPNNPLAKLLFKQLVQLKQGKKPNEYIFTVPKSSGAYMRVGATLVNKLWHELGVPADDKNFGVHKMRHVRGTEEFEKVLAASESKIFTGKALTQKQADDIFMRIAVKVGERLGHATGVGPQQKTTGTTAIQNYIDPDVMRGFYDRLNLRYPKFLKAK